MSSGELVFTRTGGEILGVYTSEDRNSLWFYGPLATDGVVITKSDGGLFDFYSMDMALSATGSLLSDTFTVNGSTFSLGTSLSTIVFDLQDMASVTISGLFAAGSTSGFWIADNVVYDERPSEQPPAAVPLPAGLPLLGAALAGLALASRRRAA